MKAVIVDLRGRQAAALCEDGRVVKLADKGYSLGQRVDLLEHRRGRPAWLRAVASVAAAAVLVLGVGGAVYALPYGVVSLDVNPSIEYTINRFDYVLSVDGVNAEGKALLSEMDTSKLVHRPIGDALTASVEQLEAGDWLDLGEILLAAGTKASTHTEKLLGELEDELRRERQDLTLHACSVSPEEVAAAREAGMSPGRQHVLSEISENRGEAFSFGEWTERPVTELMQELERSRAPQPDAAPADEPEHGRQTQPAPAGQDEPRAEQGGGPSSEVGRSEPTQQAGSAAERTLDSGSGQLPQESSGPAQPEGSSGPPQGKPDGESPPVPPPQAGSGGVSPGGPPPSMSGGSGRP